MANELKNTISRKPSNNNSLDSYNISNNRKISTFQKQLRTVYSRILKISPKTSTGVDESVETLLNKIIKTAVRLINLSLKN